MAGTVVTGGPPANAVGTEEFVVQATTGESEKIVDMADKIAKLDTDDAQFSTISDKLSSRTAVREKVNWLEEEDFPRQVTTTTAQLSTDTTLVLTAGQGLTVQPNDLLRNMRTGEGIRISVVATDTLTIVRGIGAASGGIAAASINSGDVFLVVGDAQPQGSDFPVMRYLQRVIGYNYTQITRTPWTFTGTATSIELYGGREPAKEAVRKAREHKRKWEAIAFYGMRSFAANVATPLSADPQGTAGGALEFIQSIKRDASTSNSGVFTPGFFDQFVTDVFAHGSTTNKVFFAAPAVAQVLSSYNRQGMGAYWQPTPDNVYGVKVDAFISGAYGWRIPVIVKREWSQFPAANKGFGSYGFLIDMDYVQSVPLRDRDTKLLTDQQPKGRDVYSAEYFREATYQFAHNRCHGIIYGAAAPT
jgi:uncharacterized protein DUF5309